MNAKKAKALRKALLPGRAETGASRGVFARTLTKYNESDVRKFILSYPLDEDGNEQEDFEYFKSTVTLDPECPRALYKKFKRISDVRQQKRGHGDSGAGSEGDESA